MEKVQEGSKEGSGKKWKARMSLRSDEKKVTFDKSAKSVDEHKQEHENETPPSLNNSNSDDR